MQMVESGERETRGRLFGRCEKLLRERRTLYSRLRKECKLKGKVHWPVRRMFQEEKATGAVMAFLRDTTIEYKVPWGGNLWPGAEENCPVRFLGSPFPFVFSFVFPFVFSFVFPLSLPLFQFFMVVRANGSMGGGLTRAC